jgi:uncharacterized protein YkwD
VRLIRSLPGLSNLTVVFKMRRVCSFWLLSLVAFLFATDLGAARPVCAQQADTVDLRGRSRGKNDSNSSRPRVNADERDSKPSADVALPTEIESLELQCLSEINRLRRAYRLAPLEFNQELLPVARSYSRRMAEEGFFSHTDPEGRGTNHRLNVAGIRWRALAENIASERGWVNPVAVTVHGWMDSAGHRSNILSADFDQTAVGAWISENGAVYFTQIFIRRY